MKKNKTIKIIIFLVGIVSLLIYLTFYHGFYAFSDKFTDAYTGPITKQIRYFMNYDAFIIAENRHKDPIFVYDDNAFQFTKSHFSDVIEKIQDEYKLEKFSKHNVTEYKNILNQIHTDNDSQQEIIDLFIKFIEIYENTNKRWIYIPSKGFNRVYPY